MRRLVQELFSEPDDTTTGDEPLVIHSRPGRGRYLAIFVHGLGGSRYGDGSTWGNYPKLIFANFPIVDVGMYSYRTLLKRLVFWKSIRLEKEAEVFADLLRNLPEYRGFFLLGHSMGGLLCKAAIAHLVTTKQLEVAQRIKGLFLMATPQYGSIRVPRMFSWITKDFQALKPHSNLAANIENVFANQVYCGTDYPLDDTLHIPCRALLAAADFWVDPLSAGTGMNADRMRTVRGTHTSIVKPKSLNDDGFRFVTSCLKDAISSVAEPFRNDECSQARYQELGTINELGTKLLRATVSDVGLMRQWWKVNPSVFWVIRRVTIAPAQRIEKIVGYFCVIPLKEKAVSPLCSGEITGLNLRPELIAVNVETAKAVYVGAIAGTDRAAGGSALHYLTSHLRSLSRAGSVRVLAKPINEHSLGIVVGYAMTPVDGVGGVDHVYEADPAQSIM